MQAHFEFSQSSSHSLSFPLTKKLNVESQKSVKLQLFELIASMSLCSHLTEAAFICSNPRGDTVPPDSENKNERE